jgi:hypothetical protein
MESSLEHPDDLANLSLHLCVQLLHLFPE